MQPGLDHLCAGLQVMDYGIGAMQEEGVWYFAFGANMTTKKLTESREIKPLEATKGFLPGWRLAFNHKCDSPYLRCVCSMQGVEAC
jgi:hypothetical protein